MLQRPGVLAYTCNLSFRRLRQEDLELRANLGYIVRLSLKKKKNHASSKFSAFPWEL
jgi:hypothetical protein